MVSALFLQALQVLDSLVLPSTDQLDVKDKAAVSKQQQTDWLPSWRPQLQQNAQ